MIFITRASHWARAQRKSDVSNTPGAASHSGHVSRAMGQPSHSAIPTPPPVDLETAIQRARNTPGRLILSFWKKQLLALKRLVRSIRPIQGAGPGLPQIGGGRIGEGGFGDIGAPSSPSLDWRFSLVATVYLRMRCDGGFSQRFLFRSGPSANPLWAGTILLLGHRGVFPFGRRIPVSP